MPKDIRPILAHFEDAKEQLLAIGDDIWLSIDHTDNEALESGLAFKKAFNDRIAELDRLSSEISVMLQQFTGMRAPDFREKESARARDNDRVVKTLDRLQPHTINEDFCYKRPCGFILQGQGFEQTDTWRDLYLSLLAYLRQKHTNLFLEIAQADDFISKRGNHSFSTDPGALRVPVEVGEGVHAETNLSANSIRDSIRRLLPFFGYGDDEMTVYLREDRNDGEDKA